jgi:hypothetical protein
MAEFEDKKSSFVTEPNGEKGIKRKLSSEQKNGDKSDHDSKAKKKKTEPVKETTSAATGQSSERHE